MSTPTTSPPRAKFSILNSQFSILLILLLALALRLLLWAQPAHQPANDEVEYLRVARDLLAGRGWQLYTAFPWLRAPLYPIYLALSLWLTGGNETLAALVNIALSVANVYLAYLLAAALVGRRAALLAALLTAVLWTNVTFASLFMSETLFTFLFSAGLLCTVRAARTERRWLYALAAGVLFGLAALTRSLLLPFIPVAAFWLLVQPVSAVERTRRRWLPALLLVLACVLAVAPWTLRNMRAYGRPIPIETGLSYNIWAFNEPGVRLSAIAQILSAIPNPAERADYATARGLERLREDPAIVARKLWPNWVYLWRVKPIEDRFLMEDYRSDIGLPLFTTALLLDDLLYFVLAMAGVAGLVAALKFSSPSWRTRLSSPAALAAAWCLVVIGTVLLTHGEARYRHFLFPVLIPYAALALRCVWRGQWRTLRLPAAAAIAVLCVLVAWPLLLHYPWEWAGSNLARGWYALRGDIALARGDAMAALAAYDQALDIDDTLDGRIRRGNAYRALGDMQRARDDYDEATDMAASYAPAHAMLGDLLRTEGDLNGARQAFAGAPQTALTAWAWRELPSTPPATLDIGGGLDAGFVAGMYDPEAQQDTTARWTDGNAKVRLAPAATGDGAMLLRLRLAAPQPGASVTPTRVCVAGQCQTFLVTPTWREYTLQLPAGAAPLVEIHSDTFADDAGRTLGVLVDRVGVY